MIKSFANKKTESIFHGIYSHGIRKEFTSTQVVTAERRLDLLNCAEDLEGLLQIPSLKDEGPVRDAHGKYSIPIDNQLRVCFRWNGGPEDVEIKRF